jgi:hypothetical protein
MSTPPKEKDEFPWMSDTSKIPYLLKDAAPNPKVPAGTLGGPTLTILITWFFEGQGVDVPEDVALAMAAVLGFLIGYFVPGRQQREERH